MGRVLGSDSGLVERHAESPSLARRATSATTRNRELVAALIVGVPALALYARTLMRDVGFWDTAEFQAIGPVLGIAHPTGYPAYTLLAWIASVVLQPFGNEALRANLLSAILVAVAAGLVAAMVTRLTGRFAIGVVTGAALAITAETWSIGLRADPHALHLALAALLLLLLVVWEDHVRAGAPADRWLLAAAIVFGVSLANHALTYLLAPGIALFVLVVQPGILRRPKLILGCAGGLVLAAALLYAYLPLRSAMNPPLDYANPETWDGFRYLVFAEQFRGTFRPLPGFGEALRTIGGETLNELGAFAPLALVGLLASAWRRIGLMLLLAAWFGVNWFFALGYINADIGRYYLVPLLAAAVLAGLGAGAIVDALLRLWTRISQRAASPGLAIAVALAIGIIAVTPSLTLVPARFRDVDASRDKQARTWLDGVVARLPQDAVVVSWWSFSTTLWYGQYVEHLRPDVSVIDDSTITQHNLGSATTVIDSHLGTRPVFVIRLPFDLPEFEQRYVLTPLPGIPGGPVFSVDGMKADFRFDASPSQRPSAQLRRHWVIGAGGPVSHVARGL